MYFLYLYTGAAGIDGLPPLAPTCEFVIACCEYGYKVHTVETQKREYIFPWPEGLNVLFGSGK